MGLSSDTFACKQKNLMCQKVLETVSYLRHFYIIFNINNNQWRSYLYVDRSVNVCTLLLSGLNPIDIS